MEKVKVLIIGSGPAGYTAAIYLSRTSLAPVLYEGIEPGGQLTTTTDVENFPGYPDGVTGVEMMEDMRKQAKRLGADIRAGVITKIDLSSRPFKVVADAGHEIEAESVIISTGASARYLGLPSEMQYRGAGVSACATCDGFFYRKKDVMVVGGGDTAAEEATYLASICKQVYLVIRKDYMRASHAMRARVEQSENIEVIYNSNVAEVLGDSDGVTAVKIVNTSGEERMIDVAGMFLAIGRNPNVDLLEGQVELDADRYIVTRPDSSHTNIEGVFAAGDVQDPHYQQAITAAASGCKAALDCEKFLMQ